MNKQIMPFNHRGCIVTPLIGGYEVFNNKATTMEEVDKIIDESLNHLQNSLKDAYKHKANPSHIRFNI